MNRFLTDEYSLVVPDVRDEDGSLITPDEYREKIKNKSIVMVNAQFTM